MATEYRSEASDPGSATGANPVNLDELGGTVAPEPAGKQRKPRSDAGKPRGPRAAAKKTGPTSSLDLSGLGGVLVGLTAAIADWRDVPEIGLSEEEGRDLMVATQNVLRHYNIETTQKGADMIALVGVVTMIAGTRVATYSLRKRAEREERRGPLAANVVRMPQASVAPQSAPQQPAPAPKPAAPAPAHASSVPPVFMEPGPIDDSAPGF